MIKTARLILRRWTPDDRSAFIRLADDPEIARWTGRSVSSSDLFSYYLSLESSFAIQFDRKTIGNVSFFQNSTTSSFQRLNLYETAFYLLPDYQGHGYASEAFEAACNYMFSSASADAILVGVLKDNDKAKKFVKKAGGKFCFERTALLTEAEDFYVIA